MSATIIEIDARGLRCPLPVLKMEAALRRMAPAGQVKITADDPIAAVDIPHFAAEGGHACERLSGPPSVCVFLVTRGEKP
ncbi:MAG TPA: sulfurtransferase TusA family protein [Parvularcula sp.]|nr:sulfurtransferase TusA family protein [Parvularcula sp.]HBS30441.1 sulfurtransferase TusA family protein [Parvularcula sp.]HBS35394.1 sulfurtransferase TusA family protein [Parvularcula sp.]